MMKRDLVLFTCRILAIITFLMAIPYCTTFSGVLPQVFENMNTSFSWQNVLPFSVHAFAVVVYLNVVCFLWFFAPRFVHWLINDSSTTDQECGLPSKDLCTILVALLGLYLVGTVDIGITPIAYSIAFMQNVNWSHYLVLSSTGFHLLLGLLLIFRCRAVAAWILRKDETIGN